MFDADIRPFRPGTSDSVLLDDIANSNVGHDIRLDRDRIILAHGVQSGRLLGCFVYRPGAIIHDLLVRDSLTRRSVAHDMVNFAAMDATSRPFQLHEAIFLTDGDEMAKFAEEIGAYEETGKRLYRIPLRMLVGRIYGGAS